MVPNTRASSRTGHHWRQVKERTRGLPTASSTNAATYWRTATTPTGPNTGKASEPIAAPTWLDRPLPTMVRTPAGLVRAGFGPGDAGRIRRAGDADGRADAPCMVRSCENPAPAENASTGPSI